MKSGVALESSGLEALGGGLAADEPHPARTTMTVTHPGTRCRTVWDWFWPRDPRSIGIYARTQARAAIPRRDRVRRVSNGHALAGDFVRRAGLCNGAAGTRARDAGRSNALPPGCKPENPLVTEWPATEKANLEARLRQGSVIVSYSGCTLRMLPRCRVRGDYAWRRTTTSTDVIEIRNADELFAKMPLGAVSLEGSWQRSGRLAVQTTASGQLQLTGFDPMSIPKGSECEGATHVVGALSVGAFKLRSGGAARAAGRAEVTVIGAARAGSESEEIIVREAGAPARCEQSTESAPHAECASPLQMFLQQLPASVADQVRPARSR